MSIVMPVRASTDRDSILTKASAGMYEPPVERYIWMMRYSWTLKNPGIQKSPVSFVLCKIHEKTTMEAAPQQL
jgi:hypothetical protein